MPIMTSLSTRFLGQPRLTKPTFRGLEREADSGCGDAIVGFSTGMLSLYCSIAKASVFAELDFLRLLWEEQISLEYTRKSANYFSVRVPLYQFVVSMRKPESYCC
jgi:hypothetical protein